MCLSYNLMLTVDTVQEHVHRWAWIQCGFISRAEYSELKGISEQELERLDAEAVKLTKDITILHEIPKTPIPSWASGAAPQPQTGEELILWQSRTQEEPEVWQNVPFWLGACLDREFVKYKQLAADASKEVGATKLSRQLDTVTTTGIKIFHNQRYNREATMFHQLTVNLFYVDT